MTPARDGQRCERQNAFPSADVDMLAAADWLFPEGMDHHTFMTGNRAGNALFLKLVREMGGSGTLPDPHDVAPPPAPRSRTSCWTCASWAAGRPACAPRAHIAEAAPDARVALYDEQAEPGGSLLAERGGADRARALADGARGAGRAAGSGATAIGYFPEDVGAGGGPGVLAVATATGLVRVSARRTLYATGCYDQNLPFADNDRPGVIAARACGRLAFHWGVRPVAAKQRVVILDAAPTAEPLARDLEAAGVDRRAHRCAAGNRRRRARRPAGARRRCGGGTRPGARRRGRSGRGRRGAGARLGAGAATRRGRGIRSGARWFAVVVDARMATSAPGVFACGDVTGYVGTAAAEAAGGRAGKAVAASLAVVLVVLASAGLAASGCAAPATPPAVTPEAQPAGPATAVQPPAFDAATPATAQSVADGRTSSRRAILNAAWSTVRDDHYDKTLGGVDWNAVRAKYEPLALAAPSDAAFYRVLNQMIGELGQSHMLIVGPGAEDEDDAEQLPRSRRGPGGHSDRRHGRRRATDFSGGDRRSRPDGAGHRRAADGDARARRLVRRPRRAVARLHRHADRRPPAGHAQQLGAAAASGRGALRGPPQAARRLMGPVGTRVSIAYLDDRDKPGNAVLVRDPPRTAAVQLGHLPPLYPEVRAYEIGSVGVIAFNIFLVQPTLEEIKRAMARFVSHRVRAVVIDLRGNPGGQGAMAIPVSSMFVTEPVTLGTLKFRDFDNTFTAKPEMGAVPFTGPLAILTDEGSASAAEILAAGLQEAKRAVVVGDTTLGAVLPSVVEALPGGAVMQYVVADFKTPKGVMLEGRGVQPDRRVVETRAALRAGRDPVLDAALVALKGARAP